MANGGGGFPGPQPGVGQQEEVAVAGYPLRVLPNTWKRDPAPRFGEKISTGDLRYQDFNPYESAASYSSFERGYGLRRFSDLPPSVDPEGFYAESNNVDCRAPGVCISPAITNIVLTGGIPPIGSAGPLVKWFGEWTPSAGTVTGTQWVMVVLQRLLATWAARVYYFTNSTTYVDSGYLLANGALSSTTSITVQPMGGQLLVGFGADNVALFITTLDATVGAGNVQDTATNNLYVYAATADRAAVYIAGGSATTNTNTVLSAPLTAASPAHAFATSANASTCQDTTQPITSLAPAGGISGVLVFVGKTGQLGMIDTSSTYHTIMVFQQALATNCKNMMWWLPGNSTAAQGAIGTTLVFPVGRSLWSYTTSAGVTNMAAEGKEGFRPINARGAVTSIQGTTHFLYYGVNPSAGSNGFIIANDGITGANHTYRAMAPVSAPVAMGVTSLFGTNPLLYISSVPQANIGGHIATAMGYITLPADGDWPPADSNCTYELGINTSATNTLLLPDIDLGFPDEDKIPTFLRIVADNLASGAQYITASYALEGSSTYTTLGTFFISPIQDIPFPSLVFKRMSIKLQFATNDTTKTPIMNALSLRASLNPKQYTLWSFGAAIPSGSTKVLADSPYNANTVINAFWTAYKAGTAVTFTDRWNKQWLVRILDFHEAESYQENLQTPGTSMQFTLLELYGTGLESAWDKLNTIFDNSNSTWG